MTDHDGVELTTILLLVGLALGGATVTLAAALALVVRPRRPAAVLLASGSVALVVVWVARTYRGGIRADETGTEGNILDEVLWLVAAVVVGVGSNVLSLRSLFDAARHSRTTTAVGAGA